MDNKAELFSNNYEYLKYSELTPVTHGRSEWENWFKNYQKKVDEEENQALPIKSKVENCSPCFVKLEKLSLKKLKIKNFSKFQPNQKLNPFKMNTIEYKAYLKNQLEIFKTIVTSPINEETQLNCNLNLRDKKVFKILKKFISTVTEKSQK